MKVVSPGQLVLLVVLDLEVYPASLAKTANLEKMANLDPLELLALLVLAVFLACLVYPVLKATVVSLVWMEAKVNPDLLEKRERKD